MRTWNKLVVPVVLAPVFAAAPLLTAACEDETAGEMVTYEVRARGQLSGGGNPTEPFENALGYTVELAAAHVAIGPVYLYNARPQATLFERFFGLRSAFACPAHAQYDRGAIVGEVLEHRAVDLFSGSTSLGTTTGEAGVVQSFEVHLHPPGDVPAGGPIDVLEGVTVRFAGVASRDEETIEFEGALDIPDQEIWRIIASIPAEVDLSGSASLEGRAVVNVHVDEWFANVDFAELEENGDAPRQFTEGTAAYEALVMYGLRARSAYSLSWEGS
jgi:hypothetical protein